MNNNYNIPVVITYFYLTNYLEYVMILCSIVIDACTAIKLAYFFKVHTLKITIIHIQSQQEGWTASNLKKELWFLFQNTITVVIFLITLIPFVLFMAFCKGTDRNCVTPFLRVIVMLYECFSRRVMARMIDQLIALLVQLRIYWMDNRKNVIVSEVSPFVFNEK